MALLAFGLLSRALVDYRRERGGMPLHEEVWVNGKRGATTEIQGAGVWYMG